MFWMFETTLWLGCSTFILMAPCTNTFNYHIYLHRLGTMFKIGDFGIARSVNALSQYGQEGNILYMALELLSFGARKPSADIDILA
jgi:hypothetical protein